jgi:hypothetical protein
MSASALSDIQRLVECQSPTEDLAACTKVVDLAVEIANKVLSTPAKALTENGGQYFGGVLQLPKLFYFVTSIPFGLTILLRQPGKSMAITQKVLASLI